jgi:hypothetical protein
VQPEPIWMAVIGVLAPERHRRATTISHQLPILFDP